MTTVKKLFTGAAIEIQADETPKTHVPLNFFWEKDKVAVVARLSRLLPAEVPNSANILYRVHECKDVMES